MDLPGLISTHGYWVLAVGALLEGETVLALAGFAAHQGYLSLPVVLAVAVLAGFCGDQIYFWLGRLQGERLLGRFPSVAAQADRVHRLIERHHEWVIVGVRFAYGLRIAGPILIGTSNVPGWRFVLFNALGAILWALLVAGIGWTFGAAVERVLGEIHRFELALAAVLVALGAALWLLQRWRAGRRR